MWRDWINEARPKTLLLGVTNCGLGCALGMFYGTVSFYTVATAIMVIATGVVLQILCNFANDYGDAYTKADSGNRLGPIRAVMSGEISLSQLRRGMAVACVTAAILGMIAVGLALGNNLQLFAWFIFLGVLSILAALFYTLGMAYGYKGLGDLAVFIFFGLVAVNGSQVLLTAAGDSGLDIYPDTLLLGISVGCGSVMLLHVSSVRDMRGDLEVGKRTLAARLGYRMSGIYLAVMFGVMALTSLLACAMSHRAWEAALPGAAMLPLLASVIRTVRHIRDGERVAQERKVVALSVALHNVVWIGVLTADYWLYY